MYNKRIIYLHENPGKSSICKAPINWMHKSAIDYYSKAGNFEDFHFSKIKTISERKFC